MSPHPLRYAQRLDYSSVALTIIITAALQPTPHPSALADSFPSKDKPLGWMLLPTTIMRCYGSSPNHAPWHADEIGAGRAQHDRRGNIQGDGWRLRRSGHANFPCHGGLFTDPAFQFYSSSFHVTTQPSLILSWAPRKNRSPSSLRPSPSHAKSPSRWEGLCLWR